MARPKNDPKKIVAIVQILARYPDGTWIRSIARDAKLHPTTVSHYLSGPLASLVEESTLGSPDRKPLMRIVRLKPAIFERIQKGDTVRQILRLADLIQRVRE